jgi:aspartate/methionine/tyrosine aminotransferase
MVFEFREGLGQPTIIRKFKNAGSELEKSSGKKVYDATFGAPVGATDPFIVDLISLSMLHYRDASKAGLLTSEQYTKYLDFVKENFPKEVFDTLEKYGFGVNPEGGRTIQYTHSSSNEGPRRLAVAELEEHFFPGLKDKFDHENIFFTSGGTTGLSAVFGLLKDEFYIPEGYFALYNDQAKGYGAKINKIPIKDDNWTPTAASIDKYLEKICKEKDIKPEELTGNLLLCNPGNPLTTMPSEEEYRKIADLLQHKYINMGVVLDDPYPNFVYDLKKFDLGRYERGEMREEEWIALTQKRKGLLEVAPELFDRTIYVRTNGKDVEGTGLRIGFCLTGNKKVSEGLAGFHFNMSHTPPEFMQPLIAAALSLVHKAEHRVKLAKTYLPRLATLTNKLSEDGLLVGGDNVVGGMFTVAEMKNMKGTRISKELNEFIAKIDPRFCGEKIQNSMQIACALLFDQKTAVVPGEGFGLTPEMVRISATQPDIDHTKVVAERVVKASREAAIEHILNAMQVKIGHTIKGTTLMIPRANLDHVLLERVHTLKGLAVDDSSERSIKIDFKSKEFAAMFQPALKAELARGKS